MDGAKIIESPGNLRYFASNTKRLLHELALGRADVIHVFSGATTIFSVWALTLAKLTGRKGVCSFFGREGIVFASIKEAGMFDVAASLASAVATNTEAMRSLVPPRFQPKTHLLFGGADAVPAPLPENRDKGSQTILFVGRLIASKGVDDLIDAFHFVRQSLPDVKLRIVGGGPQQQNFRKRAEDLGVADEVCFAGPKYGTDLQVEYRNCDVFVLPSKFIKSDPATEALGLVLIEASMHGKPLIGTKIGGIPEIVRDGVNGILVTPANPNALASAIIRLLSDKELRTSMSRNSLRIANTEYTWDAATTRLINCYENRGARER